MRMRCLIVDDEPLAHEIIVQYLEDIPFLEMAGHCYRATEALTFLSAESVDLIFLDIRMPRLNGLEFLRTLTRRPLVIITSAYEEHALESFELDVCDYLLKPFRFDRFLKAVNRAQAEFSLRQPAPLPSPPAESSRIVIKSDKKQVIIELDRIQYLESLGNYVKVWEDTHFTLTPRTLASFEAQLPEDTFLRIHKSFLLNRHFVHVMEGNTIHLKNGKQLPIGKNYRHVVRVLSGN